MPIRTSMTPLRMLLLLAALLGLFLIGLSAARATESLAIGIIAADLAFLLIVALWSSIATGERRAYR